MVREGKMIETGFRLKVFLRIDLFPGGDGASRKSTALKHYCVKLLQMNFDVVLKKRHVVGMYLVTYVSDDVTKRLEINSRNFLSAHCSNLQMEKLFEN